MKNIVLLVGILFCISVNVYAKDNKNRELWKNYIFSKIGSHNYYLHDKVQTLFPNQCPNCRAFSFGSGPGNPEIDLIRKGWNVTSSDINPISGEVISERAKMHHGQFSFQNRSFGNERMRGKYDYFFSFFALPFGDKKDVFKLVRHMSLYSKKNTLIALNFFGESHDFVKSQVAFSITEKELRSLMYKNRFEILYFIHRV